MSRGRGSPGLRRIQADIRELSVDPSDQYHAAPLEHDMFEWHFTIRGAAGTDFAGGVYHGRILLPPEYPFKPPDIVFLTPTGRFECGVKVCLSFSAHHPELWQPAWGIRLILEALISFLPTPADGALGSLDWTPAERRKLATESAKFRCPHCCEPGQTCADLLPPLRGRSDGAAAKKTKFHAQIEELKMLQFQNHAEKTPAAAEKKEVEGGAAEGDAADSAERAEGEGGTQDNQMAPADVPGATNAALVTPLSSAQEPGPTSPPPAAAPQPGIAPTEAPRQRASDGAAATAPRESVPRLPALEGGAPIAVGTMTDSSSAATPADDSPLVSDGLLNVLIGFFSIVVLVLIRQAQSLVDELHRLDEDQE